MKKTPIALLLLAALPASADDWPQWRGPKRDGISAETGWTDAWPDGGPKVAWRADLGIGFSAFSVAGGRAYSAGNEENTDTVTCFDADSGKVLWKHSYPADLGDRFFDGGTTSTPTVDGGRVYFQCRWGELFCLDATGGKPVWTAHVGRSTGARVPGWGFTGSPVVLGKLVLVNAGHGGAAFDKDTGKLAWKSEDKEAGYSTALPLVRGGSTLILLGSAASWYAVDPANGKEAWRQRWTTAYGVNAADPVPSGDRVFLSSGYSFGGGVFTMGASGLEPVWQSKVLACQMNPPVLIDGHLYGVDGNSDKTTKLKCVEFATGAEKWAVDGIGAGGVAAAAGKLIVFSEPGELIVAPASPAGFKPSARAKILGGKSWTVPVLANGRVYVRNSAGDAACVDLRK